MEKLWTHAVDSVDTENFWTLSLTLSNRNFKTLDTGELWILEKDG